LVEKQTIFSYPPSHQLRKTVADIFAVIFSQPRQIPGLSDGVTRFFKKSSIYLELKRVTVRQTNGNAISKAERTLRKVR